MQFGHSTIIPVALKTLTKRALSETLPSWGIFVLESHHAPGFIMEWRRHEFIKVVYALQGRGVLHTAKNKCEFKAKDVLVIPAQLRNRIVDAPGEPSSLYVLCVSPQLLAFDPKITKRLESGRLARSEYLANRVESLFRRMLFQQSHGGHAASLTMAAAVLDLFQILIEKQGRAPLIEEASSKSTHEIERYVEYLDYHFFEAQDIQTAARQLGMSRRTFTKHFREVTGKSWLEYVHSKAIDHAARLLLETPAPITSIAFECGFADLSTFYRQFKARKGTSPAAWRSQ